jgi:hypothetical protein
MSTEVGMSDKVDTSDEAQCASGGESGTSIGLGVRGELSFDSLDDMQQLLRRQLQFMRRFGAQLSEMDHAYHGRIDPTRLALHECIVDAHLLGLDTCSAVYSTNTASTADNTSAPDQSASSSPSSSATSDTSD